MTFGRVLCLSHLAEYLQKAVRFAASPLSMFANTGLSSCCLDACPVYGGRSEEVLARCRLRVPSL